MHDFHEEEALGKAYDGRLMRRLLTYARPYTAWILACIFLLLIITAAELARPYLIKVAIDDHINAFNIPLAVFPAGQAPVDGYLYGDTEYVRETRLPAGYDQQERHQIVHVEHRYFLIAGTVDQHGERLTVQETLNGLVLTGADTSYPATRLDAAALEIFRSDDVSAVVRLAWILLGVIVVTFGLNYVQVYVLNFAGQRIIYSIREQIFAHLQRMPPQFFDRNPVGRLVTRATNDVETLNEMYTAVLVNLFRDVFMLLGIVGVMFALHWQLALVSLAVIPLVAVITVIFRAKARTAYREVRLKLARINATLAENINGMRVIQIFHRQARQLQAFDQINSDHYQSQITEVRVFAYFRPAVEFLSSTALALLVWYGGGRVVQGNVDFGVLYAFIQWSHMFFQPINDLTEKYNILQGAMASSERIFQLLDTPEEQDPPVPQALPPVRGAIEFDRVWFAYNNEEWVLRDVSFRIEPGQTVAIVGATGAGKTSMINLLTRFYDIQHGTIRVDGTDIGTVSRRELRQHIGVVLQDVFLFTGNIRDNITLHHPNISPDMVQAAARHVNAERFISALPDGYDAVVRERGASLSAGERQLLAFARALAYNPAILVLDEATANIDTETELLIQDALAKLSRDRTTIVIAHRLSTIQHADQIIVLHKGRIREVGTHQQLLTREGIYHDLYQLQYKHQAQAVAADGTPPPLAHTAE